MAQLHRESKKNFFDCSFNIGCQILIVFFDTGIPDLTQHQTMAFHFPPHLTHSSALPGETDKYKSRMPVAKGRGLTGLTGSIEPPQPEPRPGGNNN